MLCLPNRHIFNAPLADRKRGTYGHRGALGIEPGKGKTAHGEWTRRFEPAQGSRLPQRLQATELIGYPP